MLGRLLNMSLFCWCPAGSGEPTGYQRPSYNPEPDPEFRDITQPRPSSCPVLPRKSLDVVCGDRSPVADGQNIGKPTKKSGGSCCSNLGLTSYIEEDSPHHTTQYSKPKPYRNCERLTGVVEGGLKVAVIASGEPSLTMSFASEVVGVVSDILKVIRR